MGRRKARSARGRPVSPEGIQKEGQESRRKVWRPRRSPGRPGGVQEKGQEAQEEGRDAQNVLQQARVLAELILGCLKKLQGA